MNESQPHAEPRTSAPDYSFKEGESVYAVQSRLATPIREGVIRSIDGPEAMVSITPENGNAYTFKFHKSELFNPNDLSILAKDMFTERPEGEEVPLAQNLAEVMQNPLATEELVARLGVESIVRFINHQRTPDELGLKEPDAMLGDTQTPWTNIWRAEQMLKKSRKWGSRKHPESFGLVISKPSMDVGALPDSEADAVRRQSAESNAKMLEILYARYHADLSKAEVFTKDFQRFKLRQVVIPTTSRVHFVESTLLDPNDPESAFTAPLQSVNVYSGTPNISTR